MEIDLDNRGMAIDLDNCCLRRLSDFLENNHIQRRFFNWYVIAVRNPSFP
jgi:hypothetical protein